MKRLAYVALVTLQLGGRDLAKAPQVAVPGSYQQQSDAKGTSTGTATDKWWTTLHDEQLNALIGRAVRSNLDLKIAASRILEARAARKMTRADLLPSVGAASTIERVRGGPLGIPSPQPSFESTVFQFGFDASWEIDLFGGRRRALEAATADVARVAELRRDTLVTLLAEVARNYSELRGFQRRLAITKQNIQLQQDSLELTRVRAEAGLGTQLDVERQATLLDSTRALVPSLETAMVQTIHRLSVLMGEQPATLLNELVQSKPLPAVPPDVPIGLPAELLKRRPDIREVEAQVAAETARVGVARADLFPKLFLNGAAGRQSSGASGLTLGASNFFSFGPAISLPIFTGGKIRANIAAQKERLDQTVNQYRSVVLRALEEAENSLVAYGNEQDRRNHLLRAVEASRQATTLSRELYTRGLSDFLSVLDAQRQQLMAEDDLARSDTTVVTNLIALYKALGGGWESVAQ